MKIETGLVRKQRLNELVNIGDTFFTLMSITQGVSIGFLINFAILAYDSGSLGLLQSIQIATVFLVICLVYFEYFVSVKSMNWIPSFIDAFVPFSFCVIQSLLAASTRPNVGLHIWFYLNAGFCSLGFIAYVNMYSKASQIRGNDGPLFVVGAFRRGLPISALVAGVVFVVFGLLVEHYAESSMWPLDEPERGLVLVSIGASFFLSFAIAAAVNWRRLISHYFHPKLSKRSFW